MPRIKICQEPGCHDAGKVRGYCRLHYLKNWKTIKADAKSKAADRLNRYVEGICQRHPDRFLEVIRDNIKEGTVEESREGSISSSEELENVLSELGYNEDNVEALVNKIKIDENY